MWFRNVSLRDTSLRTKKQLLIVELNHYKTIFLQTFSGRNMYLQNKTILFIEIYIFRHIYLQNFKGRNTFYRNKYPQNFCGRNLLSRNFSGTTKYLQNFPGRNIYLQKYISAEFYSYKFSAQSTSKRSTDIQFYKNKRSRLNIFKFFEIIFVRILELNVERLQKKNELYIVETFSIY